MVQQYLDHSKEILTSERSNVKGGSKGMGLISLFGYQNLYDLRQGFPLLTTKKMGYKTIAHELIWFLNGSTKIKYLVDNNVHIWDDNAFDYNLKNMVKERLFPESTLQRYSREWKAARDEYIQRIKEDVDFSARWDDLGPVYGSQWRHWKYLDDSFSKKLLGMLESGDLTTEDRLGLVAAIKEENKKNEIDQIEKVFEILRKNPTSKRTIVSAWNPAEVDHVALPPCHVLYQMTANEEGQLDLQLYQRSCDMFLGVPFNIASYAILTQIIAQQAGLEPRIFIHTFGDSHFYAGDGARAQWYKENFEVFKKALKHADKTQDYPEISVWLERNLPPEREETKGMDHVTGIIEQLGRKPKPLPTLEIAKKDYTKLTIDDFVLEGYNPHPTIKRAMAV